MERKLTKVVGETEITETGKMCSCGTDVANYLCSWECHDTYRKLCGIAFKNRLNKNILLKYKKKNKDNSEYLGKKIFFTEVFFDKKRLMHRDIRYNNLKNVTQSLHYCLQ